MDDVKNRIEELRKTLSEHNRRYYVENSPTISDYDYDMLMNELLELESRHPEFFDPDSPSINVGSDLKEFAHVAHRYPMLSLGNTYNIGEVEEFAARAAKGVDSTFSYCCELKFDGTAICLTYRNGRLERALTRGDGTVGDDVTANVKHIKNIPQILRGTGWPDDFEIRGEIYMPYRNFDELCTEREMTGDTPFANPRNAASGSLKLLDSREVGRRGLECTLYHMLGENLPYRTHEEALDNAASWGLPVSDKRRICRNIGEIEAYINYWNTERKLLPFATDGVVIKINELEVQRELGYTSKSPRWAVAYKFKAEQACTRVLGFDYQVGRTGAVTPVANLEPVHLSGTVVKRATLHNEEMMKQLDIRVGDWVYVEKGGEIIPKITSVELSRRPVLSEKPEFPRHCPDCGTELVREEDQAKWFCPNVWGCPTQAKERLIQFLSRHAMNVLGVADAAVEQMYEMGLVNMPADFYDLTFSDLYRLEGWKEKSCLRFLDSLEKSRKVGFEHVLFALGIRNVGETTAKALARHFGNIDALRNAGIEELKAVGDIGGIIAGNIREYFEEPRNMDNLERLRKAGLQFSMEDEQTLDNSLEGMSIVITGTYSISRDEMKKIIGQHGGKPSSSVSSRTAFIIEGANPGPEKISKAEELGVRRVSEAEFYEISGHKLSASEEKELTLF